MSPDERQFYSLLLVVIFAVILLTGGCSMSIVALTGLLGFIIYKLKIDPVDDLLFIEDEDDDDDLLDAYLTPEQKAGFADIVGGDAGGKSIVSAPKLLQGPTTVNVAAAGTPPSAPPSIPASPSVPAPPPVKMPCETQLKNDPIFNLLGERSTDENTNFLSHAMSKFKGREPKKTDTSLIHRMGLGDVFSEVERREWWANYDD